MNTLCYYENYRTLSKKIAILQGQLQFFSSELADNSLLLELEHCRRDQSEIENSLEHYTSNSLPGRDYFRALEEQEFLFYRCIKGLTMMETAEMMCISRDTVYRIRRRIAFKDDAIIFDGQAY